MIFIPISGFVSFAQENSAAALKKPAKFECPYDLNGISNADVIEFFKKDEGLKEHWQKMMDSDRKVSNFKRHVNCLTTQYTGPAFLSGQTNPCFLRPPLENEFETDILTILGCIVTKILSAHPKIGKEEICIQTKYADHCMIPEGFEKYLIHKFNMSEERAHHWYLKHQVIKCDYCDLFFNKDSDNDKHVKEVHKPSIDLENHIREILEVAYIGTISAKELQNRLKKYYTKSDLSSRKKEINKLHVKVLDEIKLKKAQNQAHNRAQNHVDDEDEIPDFE